MKERLLNYLREQSDQRDCNEHHDASVFIHNEMEFYRKNCDEKIMVGPGKLMDIYCQPRFVEIPDHSHNYVELVYMYSGSTVHFINGIRKIVLETNDLLLLRRETRHSIEPAGENDLAIHFFLLPEFFHHPSLVTRDGNVMRHFIIGTTPTDNSGADYLHFHLRDILPAQNLLENMIWSLMEDKKDRQEINYATMGILIKELLHDAEQVEFHDMAQYEEQIVLTAYQYLENHFPTATLEEFSAMSMQPSYYISRLFKRYFQMTFTECLQQIRLNRAANYLASTSKPVEEIIAEIGYENSSYFHRLFKQRYGVTPKRFRDKSRGQF